MLIVFVLNIFFRYHRLWQEQMWQSKKSKWNTRKIWSCPSVYLDLNKSSFSVHTYLFLVNTLWLLILFQDKCDSMINRLMILAYKEIKELSIYLMYICMLYVIKPKINQFILHFCMICADCSDYLLCGFWNMKEEQHKASC